MHLIIAALSAALMLGLAAIPASQIASAQTGTTGQPAQTAPSAAQPAPAAAPALKAKDLEGRDAFGSDGQQVGKVVKVNVLPDGNVKDAEIRSSGFFGFFASNYVVPADKLSVKGGRVDLSMTSDQVKQLAK